jgi:ankyrin repeat protein
MADSSPAMTLSQLVDGHMSKDHLRQAVQLIEEGSTVNDRDSSGNSPLICAIRSGNYDIAKLLLKHNVDISFRNEYGFSALQYVWWGSSQNLPNAVWTAKEEDAIEIFAELMRRNPEALDANTLFSGDNDRFRAIRLLPSVLALRPDLAHARGSVSLGDDEKLGSLLHWVIGHAGWVRQCCDCDHFTYSNMFQSGKSTVKHELKLCLSVMSKLISLGVAIDSINDQQDGNNDGDHQDHVLCRSNLVAGGAKRWGSAIAAAATCGFHEGVVLLLEAGADANSRCSVNMDCNWYHECSVLMHAAYQGSLPIMKALINASANVNTTAHGGHTALTMLLRSRSINSDVSLQAFKLLIDASADCNAVLPDGNSALALAIKCPRSRLPAIERQASRLPVDTHAFTDSEVFILLRSGARVSQRDIHFAVDYALPNVTRHLLSRGGSFYETMAHVNTRHKFDQSFYGNFLYPSAVFVSYCKIPHLCYILKLPKLLPLHPLHWPLRAKALCLGGILRHLLVVLAKPVPHFKRLQRSQLLCILLHVVYRCTGLAAVISVASAKKLGHGFVQVDPDFHMKNRSSQGFSWLPERCKSQSPQSSLVADDASRDKEGAAERLKKCALM